VAALLTLFAWAASSPVGSAPDDDFHNASIWCGQGIREDLCEIGTQPGTVSVPGTLVTNYACFASQPNNSGTCPEQVNLVETIRANNLGSVYPPVYYWTLSWFASTDVTQSIIGMRFLNSIIAVSLLLVTLLALPKHLRRVPLFGYLASSIPLGVFLTASINPSGWALLSVILFFSSALGFLSTNSLVKKLPFALIGLLSFVMGAGTREDTPAYLLFAGVVAFVLSDQISISRRKKIVFGVVTMFGLALFLILLFSSRSFVGYFLRGFDWYGDVTTPRGTFRNIVTLPDIWLGSFGSWGLGWLDTPMPSSVWAVTFGIYFAMVFGSVRFFNRRQAISASLVLLALVGLPLYTLAANGLLVGQVVQPRYLLPLISLLIATSVYRASVSTGLDLSRGQVWLIGAGFFGAHLISLHTNLRRYLTGLDVNQINLDSQIEWWWFDKPVSETLIWLSPNLVLLSGSLAFGVFLFSLWKLKDELGLFSIKETPFEATRR
jgi:hypothetical protein